MIIDIRGTHGSGKSWVIRQLMGDRKTTYDLQEHEIPKGSSGFGHWIEHLDCAVVGRYECEYSESGGCDSVRVPDNKIADEVVRRIKVLSGEHRNVALEGILVAHTFARYNALAEELEAMGRPYTFCFLDTPLETCLERVKSRRAKVGNEDEFNPTNLIKDYQNIWVSVRAKMMHAGRRVVVLPHKDPMPTIMRLLA